MTKKLASELKKKLLIAASKDSGDAVLYSFLLNTKPSFVFIKKVYSTLVNENDRVYKHYASEVLAQLQDERVIPFLLKAASHPINRGFSSPYLWACSKYNCNKYVDKIINIILFSDEPDENILACTVIVKAIEPPLDINLIKNLCVKLLMKKVNDSLMEAFIAQICFSLVDKYFSAADLASKADTSNN